METVYAGLPFYDSLEKTDRVRTGARVPFNCPRHQLLPFQINVGTDNPGEITRVDLLDCENDEANMITGWTNGYNPNDPLLSNFGTFTSSGPAITSAVHGGVGAAICYSNLFRAVSVGEKITLRLTITLNAGAAPLYAFLVRTLPYGNPISNYAPLSAGDNEITLTVATASTATMLWIYTELAGDWSTGEIVIPPREVTPYFNGNPLITGWTNAGYDTFTTAGDDISALIKTTAADLDQGLSNTISVTAGDLIRLVYVGTITSGTAPKIVLVNNTGADISNILTLTAGTNYAILRATATATLATIRVRNAITEVFNGSLQILSSTKTSLPVLYTALSNDYFQYKGLQLFTPLPKGQWKVKLTTANGYVYYSENIVVSDIYPNQITGWENLAFFYDTLTSSGTSITSAITDGSAQSHAISNVFGAVRKREKLTLRFALFLNSGQLPTIMLTDALWSVLGGISATVNGINTIEITSANNLDDARIWLSNANAANFSTSEIFVHRSYSPRFIRIDMSNAKDLGNILYQDSWAQTLFLETRLNYPTTEVVEVGDEKDGIFNVEKIVTKYIYRISTYINRAMHRVLSRISQHSSVTITDEVGNTYTPSIGNIRMEADQPHFETTHAVISFNDGENTAFDWTYDMENMT